MKPIKKKRREGLPETSNPDRRNAAQGRERETVAHAGKEIDAVRLELVQHLYNSGLSSGVISSEMQEFTTLSVSTQRNGSEDELEHFEFIDVKGLVHTDTDSELQIDAFTLPSSVPGTPYERAPETNSTHDRTLSFREKIDQRSKDADDPVDVRTGLDGGGGELQLALPVLRSPRLPEERNSKGATDLAQPSNPPGPLQCNSIQVSPRADQDVPGVGNAFKGNGDSKSNVSNLLVHLPPPVLHSPRRPEKSDSNGETDSGTPSNSQGSIQFTSIQVPPRADLDVPGVVSAFEVIRDSISDISNLLVYLPFLRSWRAMRDFTARFTPYVRCSEKHFDHWNFELQSHVSNLMFLHFERLEFRDCGQTNICSNPLCTPTTVNGRVPGVEQPKQPLFFESCSNHDGAESTDSVLSQDPSFQAFYSHKYHQLVKFSHTVERLGMDRDLEQDSQENIPRGAAEVKVKPTVLSGWEQSVVKEIRHRFLVLTKTIWKLHESSSHDGSNIIRAKTRENICWDVMDSICPLPNNSEVLPLKEVEYMVSPGFQVGSVTAVKCQIHPAGLPRLH